MAKATGIAQFSEGRSDVHRVDPRKLVILMNDTDRDDNAELEAHIDMLAQSIAEVGVKKPIEVKLEDGKLIVKEGKCRTRATMRAIEHYNADVKTVPVISVDRYANDADLVANQIIGNSGRPYTMMELARRFKKLLDMGWQQGDIAKKIGMSGGRISQILDLLTMPVPVQAAVAAGHVSASLAQQTVKAAETPAAASVALQAAVQTAVAEDRKVKPADVGQVNAWTSGSLKTQLKTAFENSDIDCSDDAVASGLIKIDMPLEDWEVVRKLLEL
jgi:ParB family chromosome partitioning protein